MIQHICHHYQCCHSAHITTTTTTLTCRTKKMARTTKLTAFRTSAPVKNAGYVAGASTNSGRKCILLVHALPMVMVATSSTSTSATPVCRKESRGRGEGERGSLNTFSIFRKLAWAIFDRDLIRKDLPILNILIDIDTYIYYIDITLAPSITMDVLQTVLISRLNYCHYLLPIYSYKLNLRRTRLGYVYILIIIYIYPEIYLFINIIYLLFPYLSRIYGGALPL